MKQDFDSIFFIRSARVPMNSFGDCVRMRAFVTLEMRASAQIALYDYMINAGVRTPTYGTCSF